MSPRGTNKLGPNQNAVGDHSTFSRNEEGVVNHYKTYEVNPQNPSGFQEVKHYDGEGRSHGGVDTPHIHEGGTVRPAESDETPT